MNRVVLSLRVRHPRWSVGKISKKVGFEPDFAGSVGDALKTMSGSPSKTRSHSNWTKRLSVPADSLRTALEAALRQTRLTARQCAGLRRGGGSVEFFVGCFIDDNISDTLPADLLARLAKRGIDLTFDIYGAEGVEPKG